MVPRVEHWLVRKTGQGHLHNAVGLIVMHGDVFWCSIEQRRFVEDLGTYFVELNRVQFAGTVPFHKWTNLEVDCAAIRRGNNAAITKPHEDREGVEVIAEMEVSGGIWILLEVEDEYRSRNSRPSFRFKLYFQI